MNVRQRTSEGRVPKNGWRNAALLVWATGLFLFFPFMVRAQDEPQPSSAEQQANSTSTDSTSTSPTSTDLTTDASDHDSLPEQGATSTLDTGQTIDRAGSSHARISALQWGHIALVSFDAFYAYDSNYRFSSVNPQASDAGAVRALFTYAVGSERQSLTIQYRPLVLISQTQKVFDFGASLINYHMFRRFGSRWTLNWVDVFSNSPDRAQFIDATISSSFSTGNVVEQSFADGSTELRFATIATVSDRIALHDAIIFHGDYDFVNLKSDYTTPTSTSDQFQRTNTVGGGIAWAHALGDYHTFGISYNYDRKYINGFEGATQFQSVIFTYSQRLWPTVRLRLQIGPSLATYDQGTPNRTTVLASVFLMKKLQDSSLTLLYSRDYSYDGIISNSYHDRIDGLYTRRFSPRWEASAGAGYVIDHPTFSSEVKSYIEWASGSYRFSRDWGLFASFSNRASLGGLNPFTTRNFLTVGLHWSGQHED
jgi:hypothetical protein